MKTYIRYQLYLEEPVRMGSAGNQAGTNALSCITGSSMRGAVISRYIKTYYPERTDDLGKDRRVVQDQAGHDGDERAGGEHQQNEQHHEHHGHTAQELQHDPDGHPDPGVVRDPQQAQDKAQRERDHCRHGRGGERRDRRRD